MSMNDIKSFALKHDSQIRNETESSIDVGRWHYVTGTAEAPYVRWTKVTSMSQLRKLLGYRNP